jgi:putative sterol carrier protein
MEFGSEEYLKKVKEVTNNDTKYIDMIKNENTSYTFIIDPEPENGVEKKIVLGYTIKNGIMDEIWLCEKNTDFVISGKYGVWVDLIIGKQSVTSAFLSRKLRISGEFSKILKLASPTEYWLKILRKIPTEFHGNYSKYNIRGE